MEQRGHGAYLSLCCAVPWMPNPYGFALAIHCLGNYVLLQLSVGLPYRRPGGLVVNPLDSLDVSR